VFPNACYNLYRCYDAPQFVLIFFQMLNTYRSRIQPQDLVGLARTSYQYHKQCDKESRDEWPTISQHLDDA
jgi:hypothetical protein